jgi:hypothetical protein
MGLTLGNYFVLSAIDGLMRAAFRAGHAVAARMVHRSSVLAEATNSAKADD